MAARTWFQWWSGKSTFNKSSTVGFTTAAAALVIAVPFISDREGLSVTAYKDVVGVWTICNGETTNIAPGDTKAAEACAQLTRSKVGQTLAQVDAAITPEVRPETLAAMTSFAYNVGMGGFLSSMALADLNRGDLPGACAALMNWNGLRLNGVKYDCNVEINQQSIPGCRGIVNRRKAEVQLCLQGGINAH